MCASESISIDIHPFSPFFFFSSPHLRLLRKENLNIPSFLCKLNEGEIKE